MKNRFIALLIFMVLNITCLNSQSGDLSHVEVFAKTSLEMWAKKNYTLKEVHSVDITDWDYDVNSEKYSISFEGKWEDVGFFFDDTYVDNFKLTCDYKGCNSTFIKK